ncbi:hypothetical protein quinque_000358 [Culex quinquefasciatus]
MKSKLYGWQCFECDKLDDSDHESVVPPKAPLKSRTRNSSLEFEKSPETPAESTSVVSVAPTSQPKRPRKSGTGDNPMEANGIETKKMLLKIPKIGQELSEKLSAEEISVEMLAPKAAAPQVNEAEDIKPKVEVIEIPNSAVSSEPEQPKEEPAPEILEPPAKPMEVNSENKQMEKLKAPAEPASSVLEPLVAANQSNWTPCISSIYSYTSCFLFSLETQHTIGYGSRATNEECPEAIFVMSLQSVHGVMIQALLAGIIFAKMTRSKSRSQTLLFSKHAAICLRDGDLCLMFRVGDMRKSHIIGANIRAQLLRPRVTREGESMPQYQTELELTADGCGSDLFFIWPQTVVHRITADSPLWNMGAMDLTQERFEIVVILEGTIESTGQSTQARSSYLANEILWGYRFEPVLLYNKQRQGFEINLSRFNEMVPVLDTPGCSAKELAEGLAFNSSENLLEKRPFEYGSLVEKLQQFHVEDEQCRSNQQGISKSAYLLSPPRLLQLQATVARSHSSTELKVVNGEK